ncbi:hypothetical protein LLEC1_01593 [Akanthomyces lecanii]|uniref:TRP C-terminal domain-containing protein n=1 Tax=Cordyceps confragosa TaxID=2714763 RepID=A0A179I6M4_CORDF|nr:hypothetical protein LLEC1_01593 [Akanthomyces lecanii]
MSLRAASWLWLLSSLWLCLPRPVTGRRYDDAWIRRYRCDGHSWPNRTIYEPVPFFVSSLRGHLNTVADSTQFSLSILAVYNTTLLSCDELDLMALERSLRLKVMGQHTGQVVRFDSTCPLPITPDLTPDNGTRFSAFDIDYQLEHGHQLQTLAAEYELRTLDGRELECAAAKITPYIGTPFVVAFSLVPAVVMAFVGAAAWQTHAAEMGVDRFVDFSSALVSHQGPVWATIMDMGVYLHYLQFVFLSSSLSVEYPGFLQPVTSNAAWSSLMFWRGPYDGGLAWPGVDQGIYVSNATVGMNSMVMVLGFPRIMDFLFDALLNLAMLVGALFAILCAVHRLASSWTIQTSASGGVHTWKLAFMSVEVCLSFFSMPLLAYMSNDIWLRGYVSNYRLGLIVLTALVLVYVHYIITRPFLHTKYSAELSNNPQRASNYKFDIRRALQSLSSYIPHFMPLLQAVAVGALQSSGYAQTIIFFTAEATVLAHTSLSKKGRFRFSRSHTVFLYAFRLITASMTIPLALFIEEALKQSIGYVILCLHGIVILFCFLATSIWRLYLVTGKESYRNRLSAQGRRDGHIDVQSRINLDDLNTPLAMHDRTHERLGGSFHASQGNGRASMHSRRVPLDNSTNLRHQSPRYSHLITGDGQHMEQRRDFYRSPRSRATTPEVTLSPSSASSSSGSGGCDTTLPPLHLAASESEQRLYSPRLPAQPPLCGLDALSENRPPVDYSFREADLFYGISADDASTQDVPGSDGAGDTSYECLTGSDAEIRTAAGKQTQSWRSALSATWTRVTSGLAQHEPKEEGFQVVRPGNAALQMARMQQAQARA